MNITELVGRAHDNAVKHGFWDPPLNFGTAIALIHSELSEALDIPEDQVLPCVVAFACLRYHGKSFVRKLANGTGPITTWQSLKTGVALFLWGRAQKKDPWGELYRITKFAQAWKEGDSI